MSYSIRPSTLADEVVILEVYRAAARQGRGILRREDEVTPAYVRHNLENSLKAGLSMLAISDAGSCLGELHGWPSDTRQLGHVFGNVTIAVDPAAQGQGVGRALFEHVIRAAQAMPKIRIIELFCREDNVRAIALYASLGFVQEGRLEGRVWQEEGPYLADLVMALHLPQAGA